MRWLVPLFVLAMALGVLCYGVDNLNRRADAQDARIGALYARIDSLSAGR